MEIAITEQEEVAAIMEGVAQHLRAGEEVLVTVVLSVVALAMQLQRPLVLVR